MKNKGQELAWQKVIESCMEDVKTHFTDIKQGVEMIEYIKLFWENAPEGEPPVILYEVDTENERLALRIEKAEFEAIWETHIYDRALKQL